MPLNRLYPRSGRYVFELGGIVAIGRVFSYRQPDVVASR